MARSALAIYRVTAVFLLILAGTEILVCSFAPPRNCEVAGAPDEHDPGGPSYSDGCLCCCRRAIVAAPAVAAVTATAVVFRPLPPIRPYLPVLSDHIDHPPRG